jgi:hypothetical protein
MTTTRSATATTLLAAAVLTFAPASPVAADTTHANDQLIHADHTLHTLATVTVNAERGQRLHVTGRLQAHDAQARMLSEIRLRCTSDSSGDLWTTQNMSRGQARAVLTARYLFTAPSSGSYDCELLARSFIPGGGGNRDAAFRVEGDGTYLRVDPVAAWARHRFQASERLVTPRRAYDVTVMDFTAPAGVDRFTATADVELTNCYGPARICNTDPVNGNRSVVGSRLQVMQRAANGGYCRVTSWPASGLDRTSVSWGVHHKKNYHRVQVNVSEEARCTRSFRVKTYVRWLAGNDMMVERAPYSNVYVH